MGEINGQTYMLFRDISDDKTDMTISFRSDTVRGDIFYEKGKIHFNDIPYYLMFEGMKELDKIIKQNINI